MILQRLLVFLDHFERGSAHPPKQSGDIEMACASAHVCLMKSINGLVFTMSLPVVLAVF